GWTATAQQAAREAYAQALSSQGQHGAAAEALNPLQRARPHDHTLALRRGALRLKAGQAALAVEALKVGLARGGDPAEFMPLLAVASAEAGAPEAARARFEAALAADPTHTPLRFAFAAFLQGIGDRQAALAVLWSLWARDPHDPTTRAALRRLEGPGLRWPPPWPALSLSPDLAPLAARVPPQAPSVVLRDERSLRVDAQGVAVVRLRRAVLLKRPESIARYAEIHVGFNAGRPPRLLRAETLTPDGERLPLASQRVFDPNQRLKQHGDGRQLALVFAGRQPGAVLDYEVEIPRPNPALGGLWWDAYPLGNAEPTLEARYTLTLPEGAPLTLLTPHLGPPQRQRGDGIERLSWAAMDIPPMAKGAGPAVFATSLRGWGELDTWYHGLFAPRSRPTPLIQGLAARLAPPQAARAEIIGRVLAFTEREITYLGVEFGLGAYQPRPPESTLSTRKGDCKDVTALMAALLAARGIIAYPALINPGGPPRLEGFFAPSQFSHVFLYVPPHAGAPALFLDATAKGGTLKAIPAPLRGRGAFIIDGAGGQRVTVPEARAEDQRVAVHLDVTLTQTGGGRVEARARLDGDPAGEARVALRVDPLRLPDHEALLPSSMRAAALEISDLDAPEAPLTLTARYASLDLVSARLDGALELPLIGLLLTPIAARLKGASRRFDLHLRLRSPPTLQPSWAPLRLDLGRGALTARLRERRRAGEITLTLRLIQRADAGDEAQAALFKALRLALEGATLRPGPRFQRLDFLKAIAAERPQDARLQILYAHALFERGDFKAIPPILGHVEQLEARLLLAMTHTALGDRPATITALHAALKSPRARPEHALMLAGALREAGDEAGAVEILDAALRRAPDHEGLVLALIRALVAAGATAEARARLDAWTPNTEEGHAARAALRRVLDAAR
ncbi:DUF3857 domain-containing protein, partial [Myxococcota bacterium]|nr:DUF3857 domain-containing protein [Myxococcota bacterium]